MMIQISWAAIGVIVAVIVHAGATIWWASKMTNEMAHVHTCLENINEGIKERDKSIAALWKKSDEINGRLIKVEAVVENEK